MKDLKFELINTDVVDNFEVFNENYESVLLQGVVSRVNLKVCLKEDESISMYHSISLDFPKLSSFLEEEDVTKAKVLKWATDSISEQQKEIMYNSLLKRKNNTMPTQRKVEFK